MTFFRSEFRTKEGSRERKKKKQRAAQAVLLEQEIQIEEDLHDEEYIAEVYREVAGPSALEALNRGLRDQKVMFDILDPEIRQQRERERKEVLKKQPAVEVAQRRRTRVPESLSSESVSSGRHLMVDTR